MVWIIQRLSSLRSRSPVGVAQLWIVRHHHTRYMKTAFTVLALGLLLTACSRRDATQSHQIAGSWISTRSGAEMVISSDGSWLTRNIVPGHTNTFSGTWQTNDGFFIMTLTNSPNPNRPASSADVVRYKIIRVDEHQFIYEDSGRTVTLTR
jgi:hypothetical protein